MSYSFYSEKSNRYDFELSHAAYRLVRRIRPIEKGHQVLITADSASDMRVVEATAAAVFAVGGLPTVVMYPSLFDDEQIISEPLVGAASKAEVWFDFAVSYRQYSSAQQAALLNGCIYFRLTGMDADMMVRTIGQTDCKLLRQMGTWLYTQSQAAETVCVETPAGTCLSMSINKAGDPYWEPPPEIGGYSQVLSGQSGFLIYRESVEGTLVIDGSVSHPKNIGIFQHPAFLKIKSGYIQDIQGGIEANCLESFLRQYNNPDSLLIDHVCYGFNPGVTKMRGRFLEDERLFGCIEFGIGATTYGSPVHTDGICLNPSIWLDDMLIEEKGCYVHPELVNFCEQMGVLGY